nr:HIT family protein [uncultured Flavobacterium sp.]
MYSSNSSSFNPDGFNVRINTNEDAGQTIWHCHIHIIPRYKGDVENPRGGIFDVLFQVRKLFSPSKSNRAILLPSE